MTRSLISGQVTIKTSRRCRPRSRTTIILLVLVQIILELLSGGYTKAQDVNEFSSELLPISGQVQPLQVNQDNDDDQDNEISRSDILIEPPQDTETGQLASGPSLYDDDQFGELALAKLLASSSQNRKHTNQYGEVYLLEDKDYPKSLFEDYAREQVGQVSGIASLLDSERGEIVLFHRATRHWDESTFNKSSKQVDFEKQNDLIKENTLMIIDRNGRALKSFGSQLFYMPHSVASDHLGNLWVSDVARHQVMRLPAIRINSVNTNKANDSGTPIWPDIILGEAFVPGTDATHFCQPSEIVVSSNGQLVYVADGYCNQRIMVFSGSNGKLVGSFGQNENMKVVHSLTLIEDKNLLCVADRENHRIHCYNAGLQGEYTRLGELIDQIEYPIGRVFAISSVSPDHLLVSSNQVGTNRYDLAILNPFTHELKLVWTSSDLLEPHSLTTTVDRQYAYAADLSKDAYKKVFKFHVIQRKN